MPEPFHALNEKRADFGQQALAELCARCPRYEEADPDAALTDFLCDLLHWDPERVRGAYNRALMHHAAEIDPDDLEQAYRETEEDN